MRSEMVSPSIITSSIEPSTNTSKAPPIAPPMVTSAVPLNSVAGIAPAAQGLLYFHWNDRWSIELELAHVLLRRHSKATQSIVVSPEKVTLTGDFGVTAVEQEMYDLSFFIPGEQIIGISITPKAFHTKARSGAFPLREPESNTIPNPERVPQ